jgi:Ca2+-binding RTX toxin-like protein
MRITSPKLTRGRWAVLSATGAFLMGLAVLNPGGAHAIGGLCNGEPASHTWLDASGQPGPAVLEGTKGDDTIIGSDGDDTIDGRGGNDFICGGPGNDSITVGPGGNSVVRGDTGDDSISTDGTVHSVTELGGPGNDTLQVGNTVAPSYLVGGPDDDVLIHDGGGHVKMDGGDGFDDCLPRGGDEVVNCEY